MLRLKKIILVQFYLYEAVELPLTGDVAVLGPNASGKTSLLDAIQIVYTGGHRGYLAFNAQSTGARNKRSVRDYCLGTIQAGEEENARTDRKRDHATTYISLIYADESSARRFSAGVCLQASADDRDHKVNGLFVLPGVGLTLADHLETSGDDQLPLQWKDFAQRAKRLAATVGMTPSIQTQPEIYIRELLHQLQPQARHINAKDFLKAFKNSMRLKDIESVDSYVRQHVIDEQQIDRSKAKAQIDQFLELQKLVEAVKARISEMEALKTQYVQLAREFRKAASLRALAAVYETEQASEEVSALQEQMEMLQGLSMEAQERLATAKAAYEAKDQELLQALNDQDPAVGLMEAYEALKQQSDREELQFRRSLLDMTDRLVKALRSMESCGALSSQHHVLVPAQKGLDQVHLHLVEGEFDQAGGQLSRAMTALEALSIPLDAALEAARVAHRLAQENYEGAKAAHSRLQRGGSNISDSTAHLIGQLAAIGITATPVCELVRVKDPSWQPAMESYLKLNREALFVHDHREREAVRFVRQMQRRPYGLKIVQPHHLVSWVWRDDPDLVGSLLESSNDVALKFLRNQFGSMRMAESEEELEQYPRALTIDGMLSSSGGTQALELYPSHQLLLGSQGNRAHEQEAAVRVKRASAAFLDSKVRLDALSAIHKVNVGLQETASQVPALLASCAQARGCNIETQGKIDHLDREKIGELRLQRALISEQRLELLNRQTEISGVAGKLVANIEATQALLATARQKAERLSREESKTFADRDFDAEILDTQRQKYDGLTQLTDIARLDKVRYDARTSLEKATRQVPVVQVDLQRHLSAHGIELLEEHREWHDAQDWITGEIQRLKETDLVRYKEEAEQARHAAEVAFRKDIAVRLREQIQRMRTNLRLLDGILRVCPPFSNGERYRFEAKPAPAHQAIHDFIMNAADDETQTGFLQVQDAVQDRILELLEEQASPGAAKAPNPLDDYRLLFTFDLLILKDDQIVSRLSKRIGFGSNGEHRTPFYVIAGAALAAAYRIESGKTTDGAALMLLDEAFHGMDHQNATAVGEFLRSLGLQLIMAAPETDYGKFAGMCDTIFDIARDNLSVFIEPSQMKEDGKELLQSDLPSKHPELIQMELAAAAASG
jgi:chromosome segregation protein